MAGEVTGRWQKFPNFIEYANDCTTFQHKTEATLQRAWQLAIHIFRFPQSLTMRVRTGRVYLRPSSASILWNLDMTVWSPDVVWEALATNQSEFKMLLDGMIRGYGPDVHLQWLEKHASHLWMQPCWANVPPGILLGCFPNPGFQYYERMRIQDPLDGLYWQLREFLCLGGELRLRKCPLCKRYFIQSTARPQTFCVPACRLRGDPNRRKANAEYQKQHREKLIREDLKKVKEARARLRDRGKEDPAFRWVIEEAEARLRAWGKEDLALELVLKEVKIGKKRWTYLRQWEEEHPSRPRITDLTQP